MAAGPAVSNWLESYIINANLNQTDITVLATYTVGAGNNKVLVVGVTKESGSSGSGSVTGVKHNGVALTQAGTDAVLGGTRASLWYLDLGSSTPTGAIAISWSGGDTDATYAVVAATLTDAKPGGPTETTNATSATSPINTNITIGGERTIIDIVNMSAVGTTAVTQCPDQVLGVTNGSPAGQDSQWGGSSRQETASGTYALGWSNAGSPIRLVHALGAWSQAQTSFAFEAENYTTKSSLDGGTNDWTLSTATSDYSGAGYMEGTPNDGANCSSTPPIACGAVMTYDFTVTIPGTYYVHFLVNSASGSDDSLHWGIDGTWLDMKITDTALGSWFWETGGVQTGSLTAATHTLNGGLPSWPAQETVRYAAVLLSLEVEGQRESSFRN